jgi:hypothetical protein
MGREGRRIAGVSRDWPFLNQTFRDSGRLIGRLPGLLPPGAVARVGLIDAWH